MTRLLKQTLFGLILGILIPTLAVGQTATLLPLAKEQFTDSLGAPVALGKVYMYVPGGTVKKTTWSDSTKLTPQTNPILLDSAGRPQPAGQIYGDGSYRQVVVDALGNPIWDAVTASTGSGSSPSGTAVGDGNAVGTIGAFSSITLPSSNWLFAYGQAVSRTTYTLYKTSITYTQAAAICTSASTTLSGLTDTTALNVGTAIEGPCIPPSTTVVSKAANSVVMSNPATSSVSATIVFFPWGNGDGATTFNIPDLRNLTLVGRGNMGGTPRGVLTSTYYGTNPDSLGAKGGNQNWTMQLLNLPPYTPSGTVTTTSGSTTYFQTNVSPAAINYGGTGNTSIAVPNGSTTTASVVTATGTLAMNPQGGTSTPLPVVQPSSTVNYAVKVLPDINPGYFFGVSSLGGMQGDLICGNGLTCVNRTVSVTLLPPALGTLGGVYPKAAVAHQFFNSLGTDGNFTSAQPAVADISDAGTMALQNANSVAITGGTIVGLPTPSTPSSAANKAYVDALQASLGTMAFENSNAVSITGGTITGLPTPTASTDAATKSYVDASVTGLTFLTPARLATAAVLSNSPTYANGTAGVGATLTAGSNGVLSIDGTVVNSGDRVLIKDQAAALQNGVYTLTTVGTVSVPYVLTRSTDFDQSAEMVKGSYVAITNGATNLGGSYALQTTVTTVGTNAVNWVLVNTPSSGVTLLGGQNGPIGITSDLSMSSSTLGVVTGTSGAVLSRLNASKTDSGNNTFSGTNTFSAVNTFTANPTITGTVSGGIAGQLNLANAAGSLNDSGSVNFYSGGSQRSQLQFTVARAPFGSDMVFTSGLGSLAEVFRVTSDGNMALKTGSYFNFGTTLGSTGYGFRDNSGTMQYKNNGGSWSNFSNPVCVDIRNFGGSAGGSASTNVTAFNNAYTSLLGGNGGCIQFPQGTFDFNSGVTLTYPGTAYFSVTIVGTGDNSTVFKFSSGGLTLSGSSPNHSFHIRDLTLTTTQNGSATGLTATNSSIQGYNQNSDVTRVSFRGDNYGTNYWFYGTSIDTWSFVNFNGVNWYGSTTGTNGTGVILACNPCTSSGGIGQVYNFSNVGFYWTNVGLEYGTNIQGVTIAGANFVNGSVGVHSASGAAQHAQFSISNANFNTTGTQIDLEAAITDIHISNTDFYVVAGNYGVLLQNVFFFTSVGSTYTGATGSVGIFINAGNQGTIVGNIFNTLAYGTNLNASTFNFTISSNSYSGLTAPNYVVGVGSVNGNNPNIGVASK